MKHFCLDQPERSAVAEHIIHIGHSMKFSHIQRMVRVNGYTDSMVKEAIEIQLLRNNFNRDSGFMLSEMWQRHLIATAKHNEIQTAIQPTNQRG
jgi:predicted chitinase